MYYYIEIYALMLCYGVYNCYYSLVTNDNVDIIYSFDIIFIDKLMYILTYHASHYELFVIKTYTLLKR